MSQKIEPKDIVIRLQWNNEGYPAVALPEGARIQMNVSEGDEISESIEAEKGVFITGNPEGLRTLAALILAIAETELPGLHYHLDEVTFPRFFKSPGNWWLNIEKWEKRRPTPASEISGSFPKIKDPSLEDTGRSR